MKKISQVLIILGMMFTLNKTTVFAETGSLKINVDIPRTTDIREQTFFEQDTTLKDLFGVSLSQTIKKQQTEESLSQQKDRALLFLSTAPQKLNPIDTTALFLFETTASVTNRVTLRDSQEGVSALTIGFMIVGVVLSGVSIRQLLKKRKEHHA